MEKAISGLKAISRLQSFPSEAVPTIKDKHALTVQKQKYILREPVKHKIETGIMGNVLNGDLIYLAGRESRYNTLHTSHHSMSLRVLDTQVERITAPFTKQ